MFFNLLAFELYLMEALNLPWFLTRENRKNCKICSFWQIFDRFWVDLRSESGKIHTKSAKSTDFGWKSMDFGWFCVVFVFKTRKLLISSQSIERIQGVNINFFLEICKKHKICKNPQILVENPWIFADFCGFCRFRSKSTDFEDFLTWKPQKPHLPLNLQEDNIDFSVKTKDPIFTSGYGLHLIVYVWSCKYFSFLEINYYK